MDQPRKCPRCGRPLAADAPDDLCLHCLVQLGVVGPPPPTGDETVVLPPPESHLPGPIRYFGDYELLEEVGRGGMGVVYRARQVSLDRPVAVKMILAGPFASEEFLRRFRSEAETMAQLRHPNIVAIYEVGQHAGQPYFAMEFVPGATLTEHVHKGPLPPREAARTLASVARAIQQAHDLGVLHRDLKPSNILLDERGEPRVTDFGVAKRLASVSQPSTLIPQLTETGQTIGTPGYIPPEQIAAKRGAVTVRSDVYSLGAILFHLLTGRPPFRGETVVETFQAVLEQDPPRPRSLKPGIPADLETIALRCLAKEPARRYASAADLAGDLEAWMESKPIQARRFTLAERLWLWAKRKPAVAALSAVCGLSLLGGAAGVLWEWRIAEQHRREAEAITLRIQGREAERLFDAHRSHEALATLAASVRRNPENRIAASRLVSALTYRNFVLPSTPTLADGSQILWAGFTPNGTRALTLTSDSKLRVWDPATGQPLTPPLEHPGEVGNLALSADGKVLLAISEGGTLLFRNPQNGALLETIPVPGLTRNAALSPDGTTIAAGLTNGTVLLLDRRLQPAARREILAHQKAISWVEFSRDGRFLVTAADDGLAKVWAAGSNFTRVAELPHNPPISQASASPDGQRVATVGGVEVKLWEIPSGRRLTNLTFPQAVEVAAFSPDSARLALGLRDGNVRLLDAQTGRELLRREAHTKKIYAIDFSPNGQFVASASDDATVQVWDVHSGDLVCEPIPHANSATAAQFSPDGLQLITATLYTSAHLWDVRPGAAVPVSIRDQDSVRAVAFSASPVELLTVSSRGAVRAWNPHTGTLRRTIRQPGDPMFWATFDEPRRHVMLAQRDARAFVLDLASAQSTPLAATVSAQIVAHAFSPDGTRVAVGDGATTYVCEVASGRRVLPPLECRGVGGSFPHQAYSLCFSPDGRQLLVACYNLHARLWDLQTGAVLADFLHAGPVATAEFTPDGTRFLTASYDNLARVWSVTNAAKPLVSFRHRERPDAARLSPDGRRVLTSTFENNAFVWDATTGARLSPALNHRRTVQRGLFSPDSSEVLTRSDDGTFRRWDAITGLPLVEPYVSGPDGSRAEAAAAPAWDWFAAASGRPEVTVWHEESWPLPAPDWLPELAEAVAGLRLQPSGVETPVPATELLRLKARFANEKATDPWARWAKWFLADRSTRTIAWDSEVSVPAHVESLIAADTVESLRQAVRFAPTNALALAHLARATLTDTNNPCRRPEADFLSRRAVELAPQSAEVKRLREEVVSRIGQTEEGK